MRKIFLILALLFAFAAPVYAQDVTGVHIIVGPIAGPYSTWTAGTGNPEGSLIGNTGDQWIELGDGQVWGKWFGTGDAFGWRIGFHGNADITGNLTMSGWITTSPWASETTGWRITSEGFADFRYVFSNELRVKLFSADLEQVLRGSAMVAKSFGTVSQAFTCPTTSTTSTLWVDDAPELLNTRVFHSGDSIVIRTMTRSDGSALGGTANDGNLDLTITDCSGTVSSYTDGTGSDENQQSWTFTRGSAGNTGAMGTSGASTVVVPIKTVAIDYGVSGDGVVEQSAVDGLEGIYAPYIQTKKWTTSPVAANFAVTTRLGNLRGINGVANEYGLWAGTGAGASGRWMTASNLGVTLNNLDFNIYTSGVKTITMVAGGPYFSIGTPAPTLYSGGTPTDQDGCWMGLDGGAYKFRCSDPSTGYGVFWNGSGLNIVGDFTSSGGNFTVDSSGVRFTALPAGQSISYCYGFTSVYAGTNFDATCSYEVTGSRYIGVQNTTTTTGKTLTSGLYAQNGESKIVSLNATVTPTEGYFTISANDYAYFAMNYMYTSGWLGLGVAPSKPFHIYTTVDGPMLLNYDVAGAYTAFEFQQQGAPTGVCNVSGGGTFACVDASDRALKHDIEPLADQWGLDIIRAVSPMSYIRNERTETAFGFIAQDVQAVFPAPVTPLGSSGYLGLDYSRLVVPLWSATRELDEEMQQLKERIRVLEERETVRQMLNQGLIPLEKK